MPESILEVFALFGRSSVPICALIYSILGAPGFNAGTADLLESSCTCESASLCADQTASCSIALGFAATTIRIRLFNLAGQSLLADEQMALCSDLAAVEHLEDHLLEILPALGVRMDPFILRGLINHNFSSHFYQQMIEVFMAPPGTELPESLEVDELSPPVLIPEPFSKLNHRQHEVKDDSALILLVGGTWANNQFADFEKECSPQ